MKKLFAMMMALTMMLSLGACGGQTGTESESPAEPPVVEQPAQPEIPAEPVQPEEPEIPAEPESKFDTSWAANEFEARLPELPFSGWSVKEDDAEYKMELGGLDTTNITDAEGKTTGFGADKTALMEYLDSLTAYGFSVEETGGIEGYPYEWSILDEAGNEIEITCAEGYCWVTIQK